MTLKPDDKICLFTTLNDNHIKLYQAFMRSFLHHNPWFCYDLVILDLGLSEESIKIIYSYYNGKKIKVKKPNKDLYRDINWKATHPKLRPTYYKLDAFACSEYSKVISIDMDMIVLGDLSEVFECEEGFAACKAYNQNADKIADSINSGLFVINAKYLNGSVHRQVIKTARRGHSMPDQKTLNKYFKNRIHYLPKKYNVEKRVFKTRTLKDLLDEVVIWHYIAEKPYEDHSNSPKEQGFDEIENIWWEWFNK